MKLDTRRTIRKYLLTYPEWRCALPKVQLMRDLRKAGSDYGGYWLDPSGLQRDSVVYSLGIGEDISFDLALIQGYGVMVYAFDPTPRVRDWLAAQEVPDGFCYRAVGISNYDGDAEFYKPRRATFVSHSLMHTPEYSHASIRVPMIRLGTAMREMGHNRIDLLKMDIEGAEYGVLEDIVRERIAVRQVLVEFHHRLSSIGAKKTKRILTILEEYGMKICHICPRWEVFTLIRTA